MPISKEEFDSLEITPPFQYTMTSYGADYTVDLLVDRLKKGDIYVPKWQRGYVWGYRQASQFIESLLLGLPIPSIFLFKELDTEKFVVIDGNQRLTTLYYFYQGFFKNEKRKFKLRFVQKRFYGLTHDTLSPLDRRKLDNSIIRATIVKQDTPLETESSSVFYLFHRLNTGGTDLSPQEIRVSVYRGAFIDLLAKLNDNETWRKMYGSKNKRLRDQELILRFFALYYNNQNYDEPMSSFLNYFVIENKNLEKISENSLTDLFVNTISVISNSIKKPFRIRSSFNAAVLDSVMVGIAKRLEQGPIDSYESVKTAYNNLLKDNGYINSTIIATQRKDNVARRLDESIKIFSKVS